MVAMFVTKQAIETNKRMKKRPFYPVYQDKNGYMYGFCASTSEICKHQETSVNAGKGFVQANWVIFIHKNEAHVTIERLSPNQMRELAEKFRAIYKSGKVQVIFVNEDFEMEVIPTSDEDYLGVLELIEEHLPITTNSEL